MNERVVAVERTCYKMKIKALEMASKTSFGAHIGGGFSAMEILASLYDIANIPSMTDESRDRIIISKGHCVLAYYTALWQKGYISESELDTFETDGTKFHGHPHRDLSKGIEFSGGSLGLGLSYAVGVAKACKEKGLKNKVYVLVGDGELDEGIVCEAVLSITHFGLDNMVIIVDRNGYQLDGKTEDVLNLGRLDKKFEDFGFSVDTIDGHSLEALCETLTKESNMPRAIIANTVKAHGISFLENNKMSHQCLLSSKKYAQAVEEIKQAYGYEL